MESYKKPGIEELRGEFADVMDDEAVTAISYWKEPNNDAPCDEDAYLARALANGDLLNDKIEEALAGVGQKSSTF